MTSTTRKIHQKVQPARSGSTKMPSVEESDFHASNGGEKWMVCQTVWPSEIVLGTDAWGATGFINVFFFMRPTRWCPRSIAKLVYNSNNNGFCWWYIYSFHGIINQLITWGHHLVGRKEKNINTSIRFSLFKNLAIGLPHLPCARYRSKCSVLLHSLHGSFVAGSGTNQPTEIGPLRQQSPWEPQHCFCCRISKASNSIWAME